MKTLIQIIFLLVSSNAFSAIVQLDSQKYLSSPTGGFWVYDYEGALKACPAGTHLPTARELAQESQLHGAKGILEITEASSGTIPQGYVKISAVDLNGKFDEFYYSSEGYKPYLQKAFFWSSSIVSEAGISASYGMFGENGDLFTARQEGLQTHVRCF